MTNNDAKCKIVTAGEGEAYWFVGGLWVYKARKEDTQGQYALVEVTVPANCGIFGSPHAHAHEEKALYVLEGILTLNLEDGDVEAPAGSFAVIPRSVVNGFSNNHDQVGKALIIYSPAGFESFIQDAGEPAQTRTLPPVSGPPADRSKLRSARSKYDIESKAPPEWQ